ncbi:MAG: hypothetical protein IAE94_06895 [Chthoniobacterales bacterium]|nr:hypothetical protein [Chthoniobacterales bacterium]
MALFDQLLFAWTYRVGEREFVIEIFRDGSCVLYDETIRRKLCHAGKSGIAALLEDVAADEPSAAHDRKGEFGIRFSIDAEQLSLIRQAREEFDQTDDVPAGLEGEINRRFGSIFVREIEPYLTIPLSR